MTIIANWDFSQWIVKSSKDGDIQFIRYSIEGGLSGAHALYELNDEIPRMHWIAISHAFKAPVRDGLKIISMRNIELGATQQKSWVQRKP